MTKLESREKVPDGSLSGLPLNDRVGLIRQLWRHPARKPDGDTRLIYRGQR
ncbi:TPA_asm: hypothetical protein GND82_004191 [Salmonella enterica subsp. salamae serovar 60:g,m,t:z6]|uniref:Uncharacterized protein n=1 Tax=Salmonella enterica subsp. houtenae serovar 1,40:z4,z32:- TaxID=1967604 RepID=A0A730WWK9_SALHO|nr:hypothetical protein [Salmonella enterica subsp. enterica serovar 1,9,12:-:-]HAE4191122.1 hypothetical protein [Salmonella enterica subsp. houtenae serovar 1,40:z4,z32:-]HAE7515263.1 hypothetical protein [Salmonella enterica subsp. salamae serovar 60:g,m,t:z6]